jgi:transcriptional regulator with XRE-family HTH domain
MTTSRRTRPFDKIVGARLRTFRNQRGISQVALAEKLGITFQQLQKNEIGKNRLSFHRAVLASEALGISLAELGGLDGASVLPTRALPSIDFKLMEAFSRLDATVKPDALAILRHMKRADKRNHKPSKGE